MYCRCVGILRLTFDQSMQAGKCGLASRVSMQVDLEQHFCMLEFVRLVRVAMQDFCGNECIDGACRWYGQGAPRLVFVERKTHRESWKGEESVKERITLAENLVLPFLEGKYTIEQAQADLRAKVSPNCAPSPESCATNKTVTERPVTMPNSSAHMQLRWKRQVQGSETLSLIPLCPLSHHPCSAMVFAHVQYTILVALYPVLFDGIL